MGLDFSILRVGPGSGQAEKIYAISGWENPAHDRPIPRIL
jgi:hypothetical protein